MTTNWHAKIMFHVSASVALCLLLLPAVPLPAEEDGAASPPAAEEKIAAGQVGQIARLWAQGGGQAAKLSARVQAEYEAKSLDELRKEQGAALLDQLRNDIKTKTVPFSPVPEMKVVVSPLSCVSSLYFGPDFYRQVLPGLVDQLASGNTKAGTARIEQWSTDNPEDAEMLYGLAIAHSRAGDEKAALDHAQQALASGLPLGRFLAGPRDLMAKLYKTSGFKKTVKQAEVLLVHGPAVGAVTDQSARFWVRTAEEAEVTVTVRPADAAEGVLQARGNTAEQNDYAVVIEVTGLAADTLYRYSVSVDGNPVPLDPEPTFRTFPEAGKGAVFSVGFGSKSGYAPAHEGVWDAVRQRNLNAVLLLGDGLFVRGPGTTATTQRYACYRRQSSPPYRRLAASTPVYAIWDDSDFGSGTAESLGVFRQNHVNPSCGGEAVIVAPESVPEGKDPGKDSGATGKAGSESPGIWCSFPIGDVTFFMLDCSTQRSRPADAPPTMLGATQKRWLLGGLKESEATFKILASPVPWAPSSSWWDAGRTWDDFAEEREEIFSFIENEQIEGVVLLSGGAVNATDVRRIPRSKGYDLYDLHSSRLTQAMEVMTPGGAILNYDEGLSFGVLEFDTTRAAPRLTYRMIDANGQEVRNHDFMLHPRDLDFEGLPEHDGLSVDLAFIKRPLIYGDGSLAEQGVVKIRLENTSEQVQEGTLHFRSVPGSIVRFPETPEYMLDPGQVIERTMPIELVEAQVNDLIRIYAREGRDALRVGRKMRAPRGKSKGDTSLAAVMELVDFRFKQTPGNPLLDKEDPQATEMGRIWFAMMDDKLVLRVVAFDAAPSRPAGRWTWNLWEGACLEVFGVNRGQKGVSGENIAQVFLIPGVRAIPNTSIIGKPMGYRLWRDFFRVKFASGYEGEPLPEIKVRSEFTNDGWILEAMVPLKLPVYKSDQPGVPASISSKRKLIHLYADQLRIEFQLSAKLRSDDPYTCHGTMLKSWMASQDTENYAYVEWIDVAEWEQTDMTPAKD